MLRRPPTALALLLVATCIDAAPFKPLYTLYQIYHDPIPSPEDGPPASFHASRNKSLIPAQVGGIVGAYIATVLIWGVLLLTVGRRMRHKAANPPPKTLELELVHARPSGRAPASPASARSATSWFKKGFKQRGGGIDSAIDCPDSPVVHSPGSFDQKIIDSDRDRAQAEMERLYAAVMEHDRKKSYSNSLAAEEPELSDRRPPRIDTTGNFSSASNPASPMRAIYPPGYHNGLPAAAVPRDHLRDNQPPASPRSILSKKSMASNSSKARFNLKNLRISGPMRYPNHGSDDEARTPLSPRFYSPGAPSPPTQQNSPTTPGDFDEAYEQLDEVQPLPRPAPQRLGSHNATPTSTTPTASLPLRGYTEPLKSPDLRTTVLDRRLDKLSLTTPKTGVPYTPYSPYMPFTPLTPVTPHLVTKKERKSTKKREITRREDLVQSPKEIFGGAY